MKPRRYSIDLAMLRPTLVKPGAEIIFYPEGSSGIVVETNYFAEAEGNRRPGFYYLIFKSDDFVEEVHEDNIREKKVLDQSHLRPPAKPAHILRRRRPEAF